MKLSSDKFEHMASMKQRKEEYLKKIRLHENKQKMSHALDNLLLDISEIKTAPEGEDPELETNRNNENELLETLRLCNSGVSGQPLTRVKTRNCQLAC